MNGPGAAADRVFRASRLEDLPRLVAFVDEGCGGIDDDARADLRLAVEEVFANIFQHGYAGGTGPVEIRVVRSGDRVAVTLADRAPRFDPASAPPPDLAADADAHRVGGLGWHLVRQVMDEVGWAPAAGGGNAYRLVRRIAAGTTDFLVGQHEGIST